MGRSRLWGEGAGPMVRLKVRGVRAVECSQVDALQRLDAMGLALREPEPWESDADTIGVDPDSGEIRAELRVVRTRDGEIVP